MKPILKFKIEKITNNRYIVHYQIRNAWVLITQAFLDNTGFFDDKPLIFKGKNSAIRFINSHYGSTYKIIII